MSEKDETIREALNLPKEIHFKVKGWTNFSVHFGRNRENEYFSTTADMRGGGGQCQDRALVGPECGLARAFYLKYDKYHIQQLSNIPLTVLHEMKKDLDILKANYDYSEVSKSIPKWNKKFKSKDIGHYVDSGLSLTDIIDRLDFHKKLEKELDNQDIKTKKIKI